MNINELLADPNSVVAAPDLVLVEPDTVEDDGITLRHFTDENLSDDMAELLSHLKRAESWGQVRAVLSIYCDVEDGSVV